jgi:hypothetical protein
MAPSNRKWLYGLSGDTGPLKIGIAQNIEKRLASYKTQNPTIQVRFKFNCPRIITQAAEEALRGQFRPRLTHGREWFRVSPREMLNAVKVELIRQEHPPIWTRQSKSRPNTTVLCINEGRKILELADIEIGDGYNYTVDREEYIASGKGVRSVVYRRVYSNWHVKLRLRDWDGAPKWHQVNFKTNDAARKYLDKLVFQRLFGKIKSMRHWKQRRW